MNRYRRTTLNQAVRDIEMLEECATSAEAMEKADEIKSTIEMIRDEEETSYDMLPEGLQMSSRGDDMQDNISDLEEAVDYLDDFISVIEDKEYDYDNVKHHLDKAINKITNAIER